MYTTGNGSEKEIRKINDFFEKNMSTLVEGSSLTEGEEQIDSHLKKADVVPVDFRVLNLKNQKIFLNFVKTLPVKDRNRILIMR